jgi:Na+/H+-dicarboxylate symporter
MASLPSLLTAAEEGLEMEPALAGSVLPLAVSTFRLGTAISVVSSSLFAAHAAGVQLGPSQYLVAGLLIVLTNSGVVGLPGAAVLYAAEAPIFQAIGAPLAFIPLWIAVFAIPDIFATVCNVTADLAAATVIRRILDRRSARLPAQQRVA